MNDFEYLQEQIDIVTFATQYLDRAMKKIGDGSYRLNPCPLPNCEANDAFTVNAKSGTFKCFSCDRSGNMFHLVKEIENIGDDWPRVIKKVCSIAGIPEGRLPGSTRNGNGKPASTPNPALETRKRIFNAAADWYHDNLMKDKKALGILATQRKFDADFIKTMPIGYTGNRIGGLLAHLQKSFQKADLLASGIIAEKDGKLYEFFGSQYFVYFHKLGEQVCDFSLKDAIKRAEGKERSNYRLKADHRIGKCFAFNQDDLLKDELVIVEGQNDVFSILKTDPRSGAVGDKNFTEKELIRNARKKAKMTYLCFDKNDKSKAGDKYCEKFFMEFWGEFPIKVLDWDTELQGDDIDNYLRSKSHRPGAMDYLKEHSIDLFNYLLRKLPVSDEITNNIEVLNPYMDKIAQVKEYYLVEVALTNIKEHFGNPAVQRIAKDLIRNKRQANARKNAIDLPLKEEDGVYIFQTSNGQINRLSNFKIIVEERIFQEDDFLYQCTLINQQNERKEQVVFNAFERSNLMAFLTKCNTAGSFRFYGKANELTMMWEYIDNNQAGERSMYVQSVGYIPKLNMWLWGNGAVKNHHFYKADENGLAEIEGTKYKTEGVSVYGGELPTLNFEDEYTNEFAEEMATNFNGLMNDGYAGLLFFGFLPATLYSDVIVKAVNCFPYVFFYGLPGTGKSETMAQLMRCFGFSGAAEIFEMQTPPGFLQAMMQMSNLPFWTNEFENNHYKKHFEGIFKGLYNRSVAGKGNVAKKARLQYEVNATSWIDSNILPDSDAFLQRLVTFSMFRKPDAIRQKAFDWINTNRERLTVLTRQLIIERNPDTIHQLLTDIQEIKAYFVDAGFDLRTALNHAIPSAALKLINGFQLPDGFLEWCIGFMQENQKYIEQNDPVVSFFQRAAYLYMNGGLMSSLSFKDTFRSNPGEYMCLNVSTIYYEILEDLRKKGENPQYSKRYIIDAFHHSNFLVEKGHNERIFGKQNKVMVIDCRELPNIIKLEIEPLRERYLERYQEEKVV